MIANHTQTDVSGLVQKLIALKGNKIALLKSQQVLQTQIRDNFVTDNILTVQKASIIVEIK